MSPLIRPFRDVRPSQDKVPFVVSRSPEEYSEEDLAMVLNNNPYSFLQIINPGYKYNKELGGEDRFRQVSNRYCEFLEERILIQDEAEGIYLYRAYSDSESDSCCGFFCATSVQDYRENVIRRHDDTLERKDKLFATHLYKVRFSTEPVLITYPDRPEIASLLCCECQKEPACEFITPDWLTHTLWPVFDREVIRTLQGSFKTMEAVYIADGHHRSASSNRLAHLSEMDNPGHTGQEAYNFFMSYLVPESQIRILCHQNESRDS